MIESVDTLFGNSLEIKILTTIVPLGVGARVSTKQMMNATGASEKRVNKVLNKFRACGFLVFSTTCTSDDQVPSEWHIWTIKDNKCLIALYNLIHATYDDDLKRKAREMMQ